jgi:hypothetical protein
MLAAHVLLQRVYGVWFESHGIVSWLILGLIAGWLAGKIARGRGFGCGYSFGISRFVHRWLGLREARNLWRRLLVFTRRRNARRRHPRLHRPSFCQ